MHSTTSDCARPVFSCHQILRDNRWVQPPDARKPLVRWCGRSGGRNPVTPTRSIGPKEKRGIGILACESGESRKGKIQKAKGKSSGNVSFPNLAVGKWLAFEEIAEKSQAGMPMLHGAVKHV